MPAPPPVDRLKTGSAAGGEHGEFVFAIETDKLPEIEITNIGICRNTVVDEERGSLDQ